jgi:hypothetical protein
MKKLKKNKKVIKTSKNQDLTQVPWGDEDIYNDNSPKHHENKVAPWKQKKGPSPYVEHLFKKAKIVSSQSNLTGSNERVVAVSDKGVLSDADIESILNNSNISKPKEKKQRLPLVAISRGNITKTTPKKGENKENILPNIASKGSKGSPDKGAKATPSPKPKLGQGLSNVIQADKKLRVLESKLDNQRQEMEDNPGTVTAEMEEVFTALSKEAEEMRKKVDKHKVSNNIASPKTSPAATKVAVKHEENDDYCDDFEDYGDDFEEDGGGNGDDAQSMVSHSTNKSASHSPAHSPVKIITTSPTRVETKDSPSKTVNNAPSPVKVDTHEHVSKPLMYAPAAKSHTSPNNTSSTMSPKNKAHVENDAPSPSKAAASKISEETKTVPDKTNEDSGYTPSYAPSTSKAAASKTNEDSGYTPSYVPSTLKAASKTSEDSGYTPSYAPSTSKAAASKTNEDSGYTPSYMPSTSKAAASKASEDSGYTPSYAPSTSKTVGNKASEDSSYKPSYVPSNDKENKSSNYSKNDANPKAKKNRNSFGDESEPEEYGLYDDDDDMSSSSIQVATNNTYNHHTNNSAAWGKASSSSAPKQDDIKPKPAAAAVVASATEDHDYGDDFEDYEFEDE